jgi:hypothetical protein
MVCLNSSLIGLLPFSHLLGFNPPLLELLNKRLET